MKDVFFDDWFSLLRVAVCACVSYLALFAFVRISGKRTLAKLNAFDFVVTVTLGSTLSSMILAKVTVAEGLMALFVIITLQYLLAKLARESPLLERAINSEPTLLFYDGQFIEKALDREVITKEEIHAAVREFRIERMEDVKAVVLELNGKLSVVKRAPGSDYTSLDDVTGKREAGKTSG